MKKIFLDFETFYNREYTLRTMSPVEYILDNRFEMLGCGVAINNDTPRFMKQEQVIDFLRELKEPYCMISHNALFDATILAWRYDIHPVMLVDTMGMARALLAHKLKQSRVSLKNIMEYYHLDAKLDTIKDMINIHWADVSQNAELLLRFVTYTIRDVRGCREIYNNLIDDFPASELRVMDRLIRMVTLPQLLLNIHTMERYYFEIITAKRNILSRLGYEKTKYMSNEQFADLLRLYDVEPPKKISLRTGKETYAFAKTDEEFLALEEHPNETVQALVAARLGLKSTIEETRTQRFIKIAYAAAKYHGEPWMPVPLKYSGAHTHRFSGDWKLNMQNLSARKNQQLRSTIKAPQGSIILAVDAAQIEARLTAWLAEQNNLLEQFKIGSDVYSWFGSHVLKYPINKKDHPVERFTFKTVVLGLGFGMSAQKLLVTLKNAAADQNIKVEYTIDQCEKWVDFYRTFFPDIPNLWKWAQHILNSMKSGVPPKTMERIGPCYADGLTMVLPSGLRLYYEGLSCDEHNELTYQYGSMRRKIYGAKLIENIVQALDRQHVVEANIRIENRCRQLGLDVRLAMQIHDENAYVVSIDKLDIVAQIALDEMCRPPIWASTIPLSAEVKVGKNYGEFAEWCR